MEKNARIYVAGHRGMVGSAIVRRIGEHGKSAELIQQVVQFVSPIAAAVKKAAV
jgi:nucleoside-diphosphate-sugar epimerase